MAAPPGGASFCATSRRHVHAPHPTHKLFGFSAFTSGHRHAPALLKSFHQQRSISFRGAIDRQYLPVLDQDIAAIGLLVIRVSALEVLRSRHSEFAAERQRFTRKRLVEAVSSSGFRVIRCTYLNSFLVLAALIRFRIWEPLRQQPVASGTGPVPGWLDRLLYSGLVAEASPLAKGINFPAGQSLLLLAEKKGAG